MPTQRPNDKFEVDPDAPFFFPDAADLEPGLNAALGEADPCQVPLTVLDREPNEMVSTFASEIVTCRLADGTTRRLLCKYTAGRTHNQPDARHGVAYEAEVYRQVLQRQPLPVPAYYGTFHEPETGDVWLMTEWLDRALEICYTTDDLPAAAAWVGRFHAFQQECLGRESMSFLKRYDADYYGAWSRRMLQLADPIPRRYAWLPQVCRHYETLIPLLTEAPPTIIHGEFTPDNVLLQAGHIVPIDWESAAIAAGEIDLAILTWEWDEATVRACEAEYCRARWGDATPTSFADNLRAARLYAVFHWLTGSSEWRAVNGRLTQLEELRRVAESQGIIERRNP
jgi:aminoglycoside phosphotransferase (APT) family kinase protein